MKKRLGWIVFGITAMVLLTTCGGLYMLVLQPWREPVVVGIPLLRNQSTTVEMPLVLPRGGYYLQVVFQRAYLESVRLVTVSGVVEILSGNRVIHRADISLTMTPEDMSRAVADAEHNQEVASISKMKCGDLPYPWTIIFPETVPLPQFPPFHITERNELLTVRLALTSQDTEIQGRSFGSSNPIAIRIDSFFDAI